MVYWGRVHCVIYPFEGSVESLKNCLTASECFSHGQKVQNSNSSLCTNVVKRNTGYEVDKNTEVEHIIQLLLRD